ncbi:pirin family protein [Pseudoduganella lutea]|uniref:Pirin family protein n=1 Tax=Pseudoduganella lutea TaxID=321985 RepID=A0A4P6KTK5_9BURK|nr:pirin family protein [Pseudoduganella lutea]QBE61895.1 pirin family protein [Pseudoduganella lutea]
MNRIDSQETLAATSARRILRRTRGTEHGGIRRLMSPGTLGRSLKPFVFLDLFDLDLHDPRAEFPIHPHSGIATITVLADGDMRFDDPAGGMGRIGFGGFEWMRAGVGVWHGKEMSAGDSPRVKGFQLWIALGPGLELAPVDSQYVEADQVPASGPARVILGSYGAARSPARAPDGIRAWLAVASGALEGDTAATAGDMLVFEQSGQSFTVQASAEGDAVIVIGSAVPHAHELHLGHYSVHTSAAALARGEANIEHLRTLLTAAGDRRQATGSVPVFQG